MKHIIHKRSVPGWSKEFPTQDEARLELASHICPECFAGDHELVGTAERHIVDPPNPGVIADLIGTPCGCEYDYEAAE